MNKRKKKQYIAEGNRALLVLVSSKGSYWNYSIVEETIISALEHFGMPYRIHDLSEKDLTPKILSNCAAVVIAQNRLGEVLTGSQTKLIAEAVNEGTGLVNFDNDIRLYKSSYLDIFGFERINPHPYLTDYMRISDNSHYISSMQCDGEFHRFYKMVTAVIVEKWRDDVTPLAEGILGKDQLIQARHLSPWSAYTPGNHPCLFAARRGKGKAVQFTLNSRVWKREFNGHANGIDDLFMRSILWAVRKPFAANIIPPFVVMSFDDCIGRYDFKYVDIMNRYGYKPAISMFLKEVPEKLFGRIRKGIDEGKVEYRSHAIDYYNLIYYDFGKDSYSYEKLKSIFEYEDMWWKEVGIRPGRAIRPHFGECGVNTLPFLKERGIEFLISLLQTGIPKVDRCSEISVYPYDTEDACYDFQPEDNDFFTYISRPIKYPKDFLTGCTCNLHELEHNSVEKAAKRAAGRIIDGMRSALYSDLSTHEQKLNVLSLDEWEKILEGADRMTAKYEKIFATSEEIGEYLRNKRRTKINVISSDGVKVKLELEGITDAPLKISVFRDEEDSVIRDYVDISQFEGKIEVSG